MINSLTESKMDTEYRNLLVLTLLALILIIFLDLFSMTFQNII